VTYDVEGRTRTIRVDQAGQPFAIAIPHSDDASRWILGQRKEPDGAYEYHFGRE
jgi:hypothetical protein